MTTHDALKAGEESAIVTSLSISGPCAATNLSSSIVADMIEIANLGPM
jgi:hypothetical protein